MSPLILYYDREGRPLDLMSWAQLHGDMDYKRVAETTIGPYWISTVWLGLNHAFNPNHRPLIFETMVFSEVTGEPLDGGGDLDMMRYSTEEEARVGHEQFVTLIRATTQEAPEERHDRA